MTQINRSIMLAPESITINANCFRVCDSVILDFLFRGIALNRAGKTAYSCAFNDLFCLNAQCGSIVLYFCRSFFDYQEQYKKA
jgi:hypothetical protein